MSKIIMCSYFGKGMNNTSKYINDVLKPVKNPNIVIINSSPAYCVEKLNKVYKNIFYSLDIIGEINVVDLYLNWDDKNYDLIKNANVIYLPGGNTFEFYFSLIKRGLISVLKSKSKEDNTVFIGCSAGSIIMGGNISIAQYADYNSPEFDTDLQYGLNIVPITMKPHFGSWDDKMYLFDMYVRKHPEEKLYMLYDGEFIYYDTMNKKMFFVDKSGKELYTKYRSYDYIKSFID